MKSGKKAVLVMAAAILMLAVPMAWAAQGHHGKRGGEGFGGGMFGRLSMLKEELNLSDAQVTSLTEIARAAREENKPYREQMRAARLEAAQLLLQNPNAIEQADKILQRREAVESQIRANMLKSVSKGLNVLTPEQRAKLQEHLAERASRF